MKSIRQLVLLGAGIAVMSLVTPAMASQYRNDQNSWNNQNTQHTQFSNFIKPKEKEKEREWTRDDKCEPSMETFKSNARLILKSTTEDCKEHEHTKNEDCEDGGNTSPVPVPAALPLMASGIGALGVTSWRRRRKAK